MSRDGRRGSQVWVPKPHAAGEYGSTKRRRETSRRRGLTRAGRTGGPLWAWLDEAATHYGRTDGAAEMTRKPRQRRRNRAGDGLAKTTILSVPGEERNKTQQNKVVLATHRSKGGVSPFWASEDTGECCRGGEARDAHPDY